MPLCRTCRWMILREFKLSLFDKAGSAAALCTLDLSYCGSGYVVSTRPAGAPTPHTLTLLVPAILAVTHAALFEASPTQPECVAVALAFPSDDVCVLWRKWLLTLQDFVFGAMLYLAVT